jgi:hypothetical protein
MKVNFLSVFAIAIMLVSCQNAPTTATVPPTPVPVVNPTTCYEMRIGPDVTAIELTLTGDDATGYYAWEPHEKDGARGMFKGKKVGDQVTAIFEYMIEGSIQSEEVVFKLAGDTLLQANGELDDKNGQLMLKDKSKLTWNDTFAKVDCSKIKAQIDNAKEVYEHILTEKSKK